MTKRTPLISYALDFTSFLLDSPIAEQIKKIILFGSVARGDSSEKSDIDIFIDTHEKHEAQIRKTLSLFESSQANTNWRLKGIKNEISVKVGNLSEWSLRRDVISSGVLLYGKYSELPKNAAYSMLIRIKKIKKKFSERVKIWRALYGYTQKVGKKAYTSKGLVEENGGEKIGKAVFIIPMESRQNILNFLNKNKIDYTITELWVETNEESRKNI